MTERLGVVINMSQQARTSAMGPCQRAYRHDPVGKLKAVSRKPCVWLKPKIN